ncbi:hypothetical protein BDY19DRAFT_5898 [Irpex rosettiformis]|uniref:Uncharacterized protein n=1 Tax=Irpex rosettiformis TaxID=378272 RepID=A0ACB8UJ09_9APHY|nr:hypothetical protein BDY19DRAFT_5898 [Irpex rosettiformis]
MEDFIGIVKSVPDGVSDAIITLGNAYQSFLRHLQAFTDQVESERAYVPGETVDPSLPCGIYDRRCNFVQMFRDNIVVLEHLAGSQTVSSFTPVQQAILDKPDSRICAREFAPSRRLMSQNFANLEEWSGYLDRVRQHFSGKKDDFFCNPSALGQPIPERNLGQAPHFWEVSTTCEWPSSSDWPLKFADMHALLMRVKEKNSLPGCGPLGIYLLCVDMVYYDLVEFPTPHEVAFIITSLRKGALAGLEVLGYLASESAHHKHTFDEVAKAFDIFKKDTAFLLSAHNVLDTALTEIDYEHALYLFKRSNTSGTETARQTLGKTYSIGIK